MIWALNGLCSLGSAGLARSDKLLFAQIGRSRIQTGSTVRSWPGCLGSSAKDINGGDQ